MIGVAKAQAAEVAEDVREMFEPWWPNVGAWVHVGDCEVAMVVRLDVEKGLVVVDQGSRFYSYSREWLLACKTRMERARGR